MERTLSVDEKIKRAEQIYERRRMQNTRPVAKVSVNEEKKDMKLLKKMFIQLLISVLIYFCIYTIQNKEYVFSEDFLNKANEILSYDTNFIELYERAKNSIYVFLPLENNNEQTNEETNNQEEQSGENTSENAIGGAEPVVENEQIQEAENSELVEESKEEPKELTPEEQEIETIKNTTTFIKPLEGGTISSGFGQRETTNPKVPKNHTGTDIAANLGTKIKSSTDGEVVLVSEQGDYGKHIKIRIGDVSILYAHCNAMYVKEGDKVVQGQEIGEVGSTGNSTGPHLHFEIRLLEKTVNPQSILDL